MAKENLITYTLMVYAKKTSVKKKWRRWQDKIIHVISWLYKGTIRKTNLTDILKPRLLPLLTLRTRSEWRSIIKPLIKNRKSNNKSKKQNLNFPKTRFTRLLTNMEDSPTRVKAETCLFLDEMPSLLQNRHGWVSTSNKLRDKSSDTPGREKK